MIEVAEQMGHAPTETLNTYGHVIAELAGRRSRPAAELIPEARADVRVVFARADDA